MSENSENLLVEEENTDWDLKALHHPLAQYSEEVKIKAVTTYALTGSVNQVVKATGLRQDLISNWKTRSAWWEDALKKVRKEKQDELDAVLTQTIDEAFEEVRDRIKDGDYLRDAKTGELYRVPMKGKELAVTAAVMFDKRSLIRGDATSISSKKQDPLKEIEDKLTAFAKMSMESREKIVSEQ